MQKRLSCKNDFESVYLKHNMLKRINTPATDIEIEKYNHIIGKTSFMFFSKYYHTFSKVSMDLDDVQSIAKFYAYIFLSTYNTKEYFDKYKEFDKANVDRKHRNNLIKFLKQKLVYLSLVVNTKSNNILGEKTTTFYFKVPVGAPINLSNFTIIKNYKELGLKRITKAQYQARKPEDRFIEVSSVNRGILCVEDAVSDGFVNLLKGGNNILSGIDSFASDQTIENNVNPYTSSTEELIIAQEREVEMEKSMKDPEFIKKAMKSHLRHNKKTLQMLKQKLKELESLG